MSLPRLSACGIFACGAVLCCAVFGSMLRAQNVPDASQDSGGQSSGLVAVNETVPELRERLAAGPRQQFDDAFAAFQAERYADALAGFKPLRERHPRDPVLAKFFAEASVNVGDSASAVALLKPLVAASPGDWQASALLVHACAESVDAACRDAEMAHMLALCAQGAIPAGVKEYVVERVPLGDKTLTIFTSIVPYSLYKIYAKAQLRNADGRLTETVTLESNDTDQPLFAKQHPAEAARGERLFSLDAYVETGTNSAGQRTQTHYTFRFLEGQPAYTNVRDQFIAIASGKTGPVSSRTGLIVP